MLSLIIALTHSRKKGNFLLHSVTARNTAVRSFMIHIMIAPLACCHLWMSPSLFILIVVVGLEGI